MGDRVSAVLGWGGGFNGLGWGSKLAGRGTYVERRGDMVDGGFAVGRGWFWQVGEGGGRLGGWGRCCVRWCWLLVEAGLEVSVGWGSTVPGRCVLVELVARWC